jgi:hypothetical protein
LSPTDQAVSNSGDQPQHSGPNIFFVFELYYLMSEIEPFGLWILTKLGNDFRAKHLWRFILFTETKVTKAAKVTTGILQIRTRLLKSTGVLVMLIKKCVVRF